jgi:hypothetical protein
MTRAVVAESLRAAQSVFADTGRGRRAGSRAIMLGVPIVAAVSAPARSRSSSPGA